MKKALVRANDSESSLQLQSQIITDYHYHVDEEHEKRTLALHHRNGSNSGTSIYFSSKSFVLAMLIILLTL